MQALFIFRNILRLVRPGQEFVGLHFQEATQGALELEVQATAGVEVFELDFSRNDQLHVAVVELVDHVDKASGDVVGGDAHLLDTAEQHGMEDFAQFDVVVLAAWTVAQFAEFEPCLLYTSPSPRDS